MPTMCAELANRSTRSRGPRSSLAIEALHRAITLILPAGIEDEAMTGARRPPKKVQMRFAALTLNADQIDWTNCPDVESIPGKCSGAWCVKGTRIMVQGIIDNADDFTAEQIASEIFEGITADQVLRILAFAARQSTPPTCY